MVRRVFFSFHYERDIWRANIVRNSWVTHRDHEAAGFWDASLWEESKTKGEESIIKMIDQGLNNTSVTVVLIGTQTSERKYVLYEIKQSYNKGNGLLGIFIHGLKDQNQKKDRKGKNPFKNIYIDKKWYRLNLNWLFHTYYWFLHNGYKNLGKLIEIAAQKAGR